MATTNEEKTRFRSGLQHISDDTIAAVATPAGSGGIAVIRISGPEAAEVLEQVAPAHGEAEPGRMVFGPFMDGRRKVDMGYSVFFAAPHSYTGEDTAELQCHGGPIVYSEVLAAVLKAGARAAEPGEFSKRSFLNGRMDLTQAEAVGDLIGAVSQAGADLARRQLDGELGGRLRNMQTSLTDAIAGLEAALEYPDEDIDEGEDEDVVPVLERIRSELLEIAGTWGAGHMLHDGLRVALVGAPNAGKSSLFNVLCGSARAIVATVPGTTRDLLENTLTTVEGTCVQLVDTAGLRDTADPVEEEGVRRARQAAGDSDLILYVIDGSVPPDRGDQELWQQMIASGKDVVGLVNKSDLPPAAGVDSAYSGGVLLHVSAETGSGLEDLRHLLHRKAGGPALAEQRVIISNLRQKEHLEQAAEHVGAALDLIREGQPSDLACVDLRSAWVALGDIVGTTAPEEIIDRIFSKFCLGK